MYSDDIDLSYRSSLVGRTNFYYPETTVIHFKGESTVKDGIYMQRFQEAMNFFIRSILKFLYFFFFMQIELFYFFFQKKYKEKLGQNQHQKLGTSTLKSGATFILSAKTI
jgi:GT2 family glycosyltransferase